MEISGPQFLEVAVLGLKKGDGTFQDVLNARKVNVTRRMSIPKPWGPRSSVKALPILYQAIYAVYNQTNFYAQCLIIVRGYHHGSLCHVPHFLSTLLRVTESTRRYDQHIAHNVLQQREYMARMPKRQLVTSKSAGSYAQTALSASSSSSSTRLNTHVLLALSFLVLSANARPLNVLGHELNIGKFLNGENLNAPNMKAGITEQMYVSPIMIGNTFLWLTGLFLFFGIRIQIDFLVRPIRAESVLKLFHLTGGSQKDAEDTLLRSVLIQVTLAKLYLTVSSALQQRGHS